ncbi:MAG: hypothetical protein ISS16_11365 [Ignavibacteria bacterium]|nr:hypothetical protein [Ignavibacteria bacterium]
MRILPLILISFLCIKVSYAQFENTDIGARAVALNGAFTSLSNNSQAIFYNPSGLGQIKYREFSAFYSPAPFGLSELKTGALTYAEPFQFGVLGVGAKTYGFDLYRETNIILSYGNSFKGKIFYGLNVNYYNINIQNYNSATSFGLDVGTMAYITEFLRWGFFAKNITGSTIGKSKEKIVQVYRTGFTVQPREDVNFLLELEKDVKHPISVRAGLEYSFYDFLDLRAGVGSEPTSFSGGIGLNYDMFQLDYALYNSLDLGITHQGTISINFGGEKGRQETRTQLRKAFE